MVMRSKVVALLVAGAGVAVSVSSVKAQEVLSVWQNPLGGNWDENANWSSNPLVPGTVDGTTFDATINLTGSAYTINLARGIRIRNLTLESSAATVVQSSGRLTLDGTLSVRAGTYSLTAGEIVGGRLERSGTGALRFGGAGSVSLRQTTILGGGVDPSTSGSFTGRILTLDGSTLGGVLTVASAFEAVRVVNGLTEFTPNGFRSLGVQNGVRLETPGVQTLLGIQVTATRSNAFQTDGTWSLPIGAELTLSPTSSVTLNRYTLSGGGLLRNQGTIQAQSSNPGGPGTLAPAVLINEGTLYASTLPLTVAPTQSFVNTGILRYRSELAMMMPATPELLAAARRDAGTQGFISFSGYDNTGRTTELSSQLGAVLFRSGGLAGGVIDFADSGASIRVGTNGAVSGVTFRGVARLSGLGNGVTIRDTVFENGVELAGTLDAVGSVNIGGGAFDFSGTLRVADNALTIAAGTEAAFTGATISSRVPGSVATVTNNASIELGAGQGLTLRDVVMTGGGGLRISGGRAEFENAGFAQPVLMSAGSVTFAGEYPVSVISGLRRTGGDVRLRGVLNNTDATLALSQPPEFSVAPRETLTIRGGTLAGASISEALIGEGLLVLDGVNVLSPIVNQNLTVTGAMRVAGGVRMDTEGFRINTIGTTSFASTAVRLDGDLLRIYSGGNFTLEADATISGQNENTQGIGRVMQADLFTNRGQITANVPGKSLQVGGRSFDNLGVLAARNGGILWSFAEEGRSIRLGGQIQIEPGSSMLLQHVTWLSPAMDNTGRLDLLGVDLDGRAVEVASFGPSNRTTVQRYIRNGELVGGNTEFQTLTLAGFDRSDTDIRFSGNVRLSGGVGLTYSSDIISTGQLHLDGPAVFFRGQTSHFRGGGTFLLTPGGVGAIEGGEVFVDAGTSVGFRATGSIRRQVTGNNFILRNNGRLFATGNGGESTLAPLDLYNQSVIEAVDGGVFQITPWTYLRNGGEIVARQGSRVLLEISQLNDGIPIADRWQELTAGRVFGEGTGSVEFRVDSLDREGGEVRFAAAPRPGVLAGRTVLDRWVGSNTSFVAEPGSSPLIRTAFLTGSRFTGEFGVAGFVQVDSLSGTNARFVSGIGQTVGSGDVWVTSDTVTPDRLELVSNHPAVPAGLIVGFDGGDLGTVRTIGSTVTGTGSVGFLSWGELHSYASVQTAGAGETISVNAPRFVNFGSLRAPFGSIAVTTAPTAAVSDSGRFVNAGLISIGQNLQLRASGEVELATESIVSLELGSFNLSNGLPLVLAQGRIDLGGALNLALSETQVASWTLGRQRVLMIGSVVAGSFDSVALPALRNGLSLEYFQTTTAVGVRVVPGSASGLVLALSCGMLLRRRR